LAPRHNNRCKSSSIAQAQLYNDAKAFRGLNGRNSSSGTEDYADVDETIFASVSGPQGTLGTSTHEAQFEMPTSRRARLRASREQPQYKTPSSVQARFYDDAEEFGGFTHGDDHSNGVESTPPTWTYQC
jgi:hypothetical protein